MKEMPNRLIHEKSPYLQQHAQNPVDWYPWGEEARETARRENKPIFLSVGYSTCHWCHVMEHESFENAGIAALLNQYFVPVKVDREERPDVDRVYMAYVQAATGSGGWPMSVWLTPDGKPFVGGTYFPPDSRYGRPGFAAVLERIATAWSNERGRIEESSERVLEELSRQAAVEAESGELTSEVLDEGFATWQRSFDARLGGFGHAPKFPRPAIFKFLLRYWARTKNADALDMVEQTLRAMSRGGMNDQLGGGFHRYSVDEYWFVPHFEKMLYDQAQIASSLVEAFQITRAPLFVAEARRVFDYVLRDMTNAEGAFFSAEDADSVIDPSKPTHKGEGAFYIWSAEEIETIAGRADARFFNHRYGVKAQGNVENDPHAEFTERNILYELYTVEETAHHFDRSVDEAFAAISRASEKLLKARSTRVRPHLDDKVLTSWNGLMISAFATAGAVLDDSRYAEAARRAADFLTRRMWNAETGILLRRFRDGDAAIPGFLDDYAFFAQALLDLYEAQFHPQDLALAAQLTKQMRVRFEDEANGGFFTTAEDADNGVLLRMKDDYDGAEPSGNSVAAMNLLRLERLTGDTAMGDAGRRTLRAFSSRIRAQPFGVPLTMCALDYALAKPTQVVLAGDLKAPETLAMLRAIRKDFRPHLAVLHAGSEGLTTIAGMRPIDGRTAAYVCENFACQLPVTEVAELVRLLQ